jgi:histidinol dehydrogenase
VTAKSFEKGLGRGEGLGRVHVLHPKAGTWGDVTEPGYDGGIMIRLVDLRGLNITPATVKGFVPRVSLGAADTDAVVDELMEAVRTEGSPALIDQAQRFDGVNDLIIPVDKKELSRAASGLDKKLKAAIQESILRVRAVSEDSLPEEKTTAFHAGGSVTTRYVPIDRAGVYVPGGKAVYPSSVVMNVVAAQAAGVKEIVLVSPPQADFGGRIHPTILATAHVLGVTEVYAMGGAGAIAALAWGVPDIGLAPVAMITGPGNRFVAAAKRAVKGIVGIDSEAGPSEIGIIADETAHPEFIAADLISQAEHDENASAVLVTHSMDLAERVTVALERRLPATANRARAEQALGGQQSALMVTDSLEHSVLLSNAIAPEHLEVMLENPDLILAQLIHAGAIFVGDYTPVSAGDYAAGSNHVLPTHGTAVFSSGLSPMTFLRTQQIIEYDKEALSHIAGHVETFARAEDLPAHADAIAERFRERPGAASTE